MCRRSEWPERGDPCYNTLYRQDGVEIVREKTCSGDGYGLDLLGISDSVGVKCSTGKPEERYHWYVSNMEVQVNFGRVPIWQKPKICFYVMSSVRTSSSAGGESEIEKVSVNEVEIRSKEFLPVFDHFHSIRPSWNERDLAGERYLSPTSAVLHQAEDKPTAKVIVICHSKLA